MFDIGFYQAYPAFCQAVTLIQKKCHAASDAYNVQRDAALAQVNTLASLAEVRAAYTAIEMEQEQEEGKIGKDYRRSIAAAHIQYGVPLFEAWNYALAKTGHAIFHHVLPRYPEQTLQAELMQSGEGENAIITFDYHEVCTFRASDVHTDPDYSLDKRIDDYLRFRSIFTESWQSVSSLMPEERALPSDHATLSVRTDTTTTSPFPPSPLARPGESEEDRIKRLSLTGTALECLKEAAYWSEYYAIVDDADLEALWTSISLTERAQLLLSPTANGTTTRSSAQ